MLARMKNVLLVILTALAVSTGIGFYWYMKQVPTIPFDPLLTDALEHIDGVRTYMQDVDTQTLVDGKNLRIVGKYAVNGQESAYSSFSTTTLYLDGIGHAFSLSNISIGDTVFVKIETEDAFLMDSIPNSPDWLYFHKEAIPAQYQNIAIFGPTIEHARLLEDGGAYLRLLSPGTEESLDEKEVYRYRFQLVDAVQAPGGTLATLFGRIATGTIDVWVDPEERQVTMLRITNPPYHSTTTFSSINSSLPIEPPIVPISATLTR